MITGIVYRRTYHVKEPNGRKFDVVGTSPNSAVEAALEADEKLGLTMGAFQNADEPGLDSAVIAAPAALKGAGAGNNAVLILIKDAGLGTERQAVVQLQNISDSYGTKGKILAGQADINAFAAAYVDGDGNTGYTFFDGYYKR